MIVSDIRRQGRLLFVFASVIALAACNATTATKPDAPVRAKTKIEVQEAVGFTIVEDGRIGRRGGPVHEIFPGDVVWFPPGEKHWHGAAKTTAMSHIAIQEYFDGKVVDWMEHVSDEQYQA